MLNNCLEKLNFYQLSILTISEKIKDTCKERLYLSSVKCEILIAPYEFCTVISFKWTFRKYNFDQLLFLVNAFFCKVHVRTNAVSSKYITYSCRCFSYKSKFWQLFFEKFLGNDGILGNLKCCSDDINWVRHCTILIITLLLKTRRMDFNLKLFDTYLQGLRQGFCLGDGKSSGLLAASSVQSVWQRIDTR